MPSLSTALQSMGLQPPRRRMERVIGPLGELGKEEPAPAGAKAHQELAGSTRPHRNAHAQPMSHLTHLHQYPSKELLVHSMCLSLPNSPCSEHTCTFRVCKQSSPLQHCFSVVLMSGSAPPYQPGPCVEWREFIRGLVMEQDAAPFDLHLARMSTLLLFPSGTGCCTQLDRALSASQERNELSRAFLQELGGLVIEYGGVWRDTWLLAGQTGWRGRNWEGIFFLGMEKRRMMKGWVLWLMDEGQNKGVPRVD